MKLTDICEFQGGSQPPKNEWSDEPRDGYIRMLQIRDYTQDNSKIEYIKVTNSTKMCEEKDILIARYGASIGKILTGLSGAYNVAMMKVIIDEKRVDRDYIYNFFKSNIFQRYIKNVGQRAAQAGFNKEELSKININIPNLDEQRKITQKIDKISEVIAIRKEQINELDKLIKSQFVEMFGDPIDNPKNNKIVKLSDIAEYWNGLTYKPTDVSKDGTIVLRSSNIQNSKLDFEDVVRVNCNIKEKQFVKENDILMCSRNGSARLVGKVAVIQDIKEEMTFGAFMMIIRSIYYPYLFSYFQTDAFRSQIKSGATTTINQITGNMLNKIKLPLPGIEEINKYANFVKQIDKQKFEIQKSLEEMRLLQESLMNKYFGG